ncbi:putative FtsX-related transmembrane transport protein [Fulvivirga imtechensis AK7]|uniref:Putative FtsX-related transmembrane transport protein n=1 Tax=Fulvivirga imtechensis AK7 TaxID=1237149 RepID=L8JLX0_9BACT|nr:ABC transporter permease [Fulvivirga imtechensis]ELR69223.1 putative FtsX-related transmembrane transport protein [Fulvivirga imtechensis AK7]
MVKNYLKVAMRNITKHKFFSIINILGLTIGIAGCLFIAMYIYDELNYDHFHAKGERIYRINLHGKLGGQEIYTTNTSFPMSKALVAEIPEVEESTRVNNMGEWIFRNGDLAFNEEGIMAADSNFFSVFSFQLLAGNPATVLKDPNSIVLSEDLARKYFGEETALDKTLSIGNDKSEYKVTGIMENSRGDSHLKFNALLSSSTFPWMNQTNWLSNSLWTYYVLNEQGTAKSVDAKLEPIMERNVTPVLQEFMGKSLEQFRAEGGIYEYYSMPMYDIHLHSELQDEPEPAGNMSYVFILGGIGLFIVVLACINFMNLTTAKSAGRAKEVGLRKTLGSFRSTLIAQFLTESMVYAVSAAVMALIVVYTLLPYFNLLSGKTLTIDILGEPMIVITLVSLVLFVGILAGSYPAFYLTSFKITEVLKGKLRAGMKSGGIRSFLVTFQFWISIVLIICTAIVYQQLQYVQNKNLGIDKEHILIIEDTDRLEKNKMAFKNNLDASTAVLGTSFSNNMVPGVNNTTIFRAVGDEHDHIMATYFGDYDHMKTLGFELVEGRFFSRDFPSDSMAVVLNEAAVKELGWDNPLEEKIINFNGDEPKRMNVIGVVKNFNFESLKLNVRPLVLQLTKEGNILYTRFSGERPEQVIKTIAASWEAYAPGEPLQYSFLDEDYDALFRAEQRLGKVFTVFTVIAIFIACLGLFGLAAFMAEQRTKEIGIRKVMGASVWSVTSLMSKEFAKLVVIAFILSIYPAYYAMDQWLNGFANRVDISIWIFALSGIVAFVIAWLTVSYQSLKAAKVNPVRSLRYE